MKSVIAQFLIVSVCLSAPVSFDPEPKLGDYRSATSGSWHSAATWEYFNGQAWVPANASPDSGSGNVTIQSGHTVTLMATLVYDQVVVERGAEVIVAAGVKHTLTDGPGDDLTIDGTWLNQGSTWTISGGARWLVSDGGVYVHNTSASVSTPLSKAILRRSSTFIYRGGTGLNPSSSFSGRTYGNLHFECSGGSYTISASGSSPLTIEGDLVIKAGVKWSTAGFSGAISVGGDVKVLGEWGGTGSGNQGVHTFAGAFTLASGGKYSLATTGAVQGALILKGDLVCEVPFVTPPGRSVVFNSNGVQRIDGRARITFTEGVTAETAVEIPPGALIEIAAGKDFTAYGGVRLSGAIEGSDTTARLVFSGIDTLTMDDGKVLLSAVFTGGGGSKHLSGNGTWRRILVDSTASVVVGGQHCLLGEGNPLVVSGSIELGASSSIVYGGGSTQVVAPLTYADLLIENPAGVSLGGPVTVNGRLEVSKGILRTGAYGLTLGPVASLSEVDPAAILGRVLNSQLITPGVRCAFADVGLEFETREALPVQMTVARETGSAPAIPWAYSIARVFFPEPYLPLQQSSVRLRYAESEILGLNESRLQLYGSNDGGTVWTKIGGIVDTSTNVITVVGDCSYARLTLAEPFPEPMIMSVEPSLVEQGSGGILVIGGSGFMNERLRVTISGGGIRVNETRLEGSTRLIVVVTIDEDAAVGGRAVAVETAVGRVLLPDAFEVVKKRNPVPLLSSLAPSSGARLHSEVITLHGSGFVPGLTVASFGSDIGVESEVLDETVLIARLTIPGEASPGPRDVSVTNPEPGGGISVLREAFTVVNPVPTLGTLSPGRVARGSSAELLIMGGDFIPGATTVSLGDGIGIDSMIVTGNSSIRLITRIHLNAPLGLRDILVENEGPGGGKSTLVGGLLVTDKPPRITSVLPGRAARGTRISVSITGHGFAPGMMLLSLGEGLDVESLVVEDSCLITAQISVALNAAVGMRELILANRGPLGESCVVRSGFVVENPPPLCAAIQPACGALLDTLVVTCTGEGFFTDATSVDFGPDIHVDSIWCDTKGTELKALISIGAEAARGRRTLTIANKGPGGGTIMRQNAFDVVYPLPGVSAVSPAHAYRGQTREINLVGSRFLQGSTIVSLSPGVTVKSADVRSPSLLVAKITVMNDAVIGARTIVVANPAPGGGSAKLPHVFNIENGMPSLTAVTPRQIPRGESAELQVAGENFYPGVTTVAMGDGIFMDSLWIESSNLMWVQVRTRRDAALVPHDVRVANPPPGGGEAVLRGGLSVVNPVPIIEKLAPARAERGATTRITLVGRSFIEGETTLDFGEGISIDSITVKSGNEMEATVVVGASAEPGPRRVAVINAPPGGGSTELPNGFVVVGREPASSVETGGMKPTKFSLAELYPNPFNGSAVVQFEIPERAEVMLRVRTLLGHLVAEILSGRRDAGVYQVRWDPAGLPSGVYFVEMTATSVFSSSSYRAHRKVVLLK